jgi:hypothetical protein
VDCRPDGAKKEKEVDVYYIEGLDATVLHTIEQQRGVGREVGMIVRIQRRC